MKYINPKSNDLRYYKREYHPLFNSYHQLDLKDLFNQCQKLAGDQVEILNLGATFQKEESFLYVVLRYKGVFHSKIDKNKKYYLVTYPMPATVIEMYRYFYIIDEDNDLIFSLSSLWVMIDSVKRTIKPARAFKKRLESTLPDIVNIKPLSDEKLEKIVVDTDSFEFKEKITINESHLDSNNHMNNTEYIALIQKQLKDKEIKTIEINFNHECLLNDELSIYQLNIDENKTCIKGIKEDKKESFISTINF